MSRFFPINLTRLFIYASGTLLLAWSLAVFISCSSDRRSIHPHDPIFALSLPIFSRIAAGVALVVAVVCFFGKNMFVQLSIIFAFILSFWIYRVGMALKGVLGGFDGYLGNLPDAFGVSNHFLNVLFQIVPLCLAVGCPVIVAWSWWYQHQQRLHPVEEMRPSSCGIHMSFLSTLWARAFPAFNTSASIALRKSAYLKTHCSFCKNHIEFPAHALGQNAKCPHCKRDITLRVPV